MSAFNEKASNGNIANTKQAKQPEKADA